MLGVLCIILAVCIIVGLWIMLYDTHHFVTRRYRFASAKIKKNNYYGSLQWDGNDYAYSYLNDIPYHVEVNAGDTIVTSGLSKIFPEGIVVGYVESVDKETANFLKIKVKLAVDFKRINHVYVILNNKKNEQTSLEAINYHE